ncbi:hypothetical protein ALTER154_100013 [Alteromonas sp. 154]|nr:hypothetical protein ALTER154_100013 [Alteromonas sp. 154]
MLRCIINAHLGHLAEGLYEPFPQIVGFSKLIITSASMNAGACYA